MRFGFQFEDLYDREGLVRIDARFLESLDDELASRLRAARLYPKNLTAKQSSELMIALAPHLEDFIGQLFGIEAELTTLQKEHNQFTPLLNLKRRFVQKRALTGVTKEQAAALDGAQLLGELQYKLGGPLTEELFAEIGRAHV